MLQLNCITKTYLVGVQLFPDYCPPSPICLTDKCSEVDLQYCNIIMRMRIETAHAQHTIMLLYGAENWIMTPEILSKLESFQGELSKRVLCWPRHHSNTAATLAVGMQSMQSRILCIKLSFLQHVLDSECRSVSGQVMQSLCGGVSSSSLVKECLELVCGGNHGGG